jgi:hypothetical protein
LKKVRIAGDEWGSGPAIDVQENEDGLGAELNGNHFYGNL